MIPVYRTLHDWPAVSAIVGTRIYRDWADDSPEAPYVVWGIIAGSPDLNLDPAPSDRYVVRVDMYSLSEAQSNSLVFACRDAFEQTGSQVMTIQSLGREPDTKLWRYTFDVAVFRNRSQEQ